MKDPAHAQEKIDRIKDIEIFKSIREDTHALTKIAEILHTVSYRSGERVFSEGDIGSSLYIIHRGTIIVEKLTQKKESYTVTELNADSNVFVGEMALMDPDKRSATVACKSNCQFFTLQRDEFFSLAERDPSLVLQVIRELSRILCRRLRKANADVITLFDALVEETAQNEGIDT